jgi:hypothetical protein
MALSMRRFRDERDFWRIRDALRTMTRRNGRPGGNWQAAKFDDWRRHWMKNVVECRLTQAGRKRFAAA